MFWVGSYVCLCVCVHDNSKSNEMVYLEYFRRVGPELQEEVTILQRSM